MCVPNVCPTETEVWFQGGCHRLNTAGPCPLAQLNNVVSVNSTTLQLGCYGNQNVVPIMLSERGGPSEEELQPDFWLIDECFIGGKRSYAGKCKNRA